MGQTTHSWTEARMIGTPQPFGEEDGYGSISIVTAATASETSLRKNSVYRLMAASEDCYIALLDLDLGESSVTGATDGMRVIKDTVVFITTTRNRHTLSHIAGGAGTLQCCRMEARSGR